MFLEDWNVIVQVEQSLQKHFYLSTREGRKTQDCSEHQLAGWTSKQRLLHDTQPRSPAPLLQNAIMKMWRELGTFSI